MKLIILNGSPGTGKSTIAEKLHAGMPMSLLVELDAWRRFISGYRENRKESLNLSFQHALSAIEVSLNAGHDAIVNRVILDSKTLDTLHELGKRCGAEVYEFMFFADKETIIQRVTERGYTPGGLLTPGKTEELWERSDKFKNERMNAVLIDTRALDLDEVYKKVKEVIGIQ
jgi:predicted kinase